MSPGEGKFLLRRERKGECERLIRSRPDRGGKRGGNFIWKTKEEDFEPLSSKTEKTERSTWIRRERNLTDRRRGKRETTSRRPNENRKQGGESGSREKGRGIAFSRKPARPVKVEVGQRILKEKDN